MPLRVYLEYFEDVTEERIRAWAPELPGFYVRARSYTNLNVKLPNSLREYLEWLGPLHKEVSSNENYDEKTFVETVNCDGSFFSWDREQLTQDLLRIYLDVMKRSRLDLLEAVRQVTDDMMNWKPFQADPRTVANIIRHTALTEIWYLLQFFREDRVSEKMALSKALRNLGVLEVGADYWYSLTSPDLFPTLDDPGMKGKTLEKWILRPEELLESTRDVFTMMFDSLSKPESSEITHGRQYSTNELWSARKVLRRAAWHERLHSSTLQKYLRIWDRMTKLKTEGRIDEHISSMLLSDNSSMIQEACSSIHPNDRPSYSSRLQSVISDKSSLLNRRLSASEALVYLGDSRCQAEVPEVISIPEGYVHYPNGKKDLVPGFGIGRYPVTNIEYKRFVDDAGVEPPPTWHWVMFSGWRANHPVGGITLKQATQYCEWLSKKSHHKFRLPKAAEWERAATGDGARLYPWGDRFEPSRCNTAESNLGTTTPIGLFPDGASPFCVEDMIGNVEEWTLDKFQPSKGNLSPRAFKALSSEEYNITKGGSYKTRGTLATNYARFPRTDRSQGREINAVGFRVVLETYPSSTI
jgi:formylglycine-generating enzyme required for sulfatase activity